MIGLRGLPATWGGVERHVEEIGARLVDRGHDVTAFCRAGYSDPDTTNHRGIRLEVLRTPRGRGVEALAHSFASAVRTLRKDFDVVHFHAIGPGLAAPVPRYLSRATVVQTIHGLDADRAKWGAAERLVLGLGMRLSTRVPHATVTVSRELQTHYLETWRRSSTYIPNGCGAPARVGADRLRERFGLEPGEYLLFVGRLVPEKAPDVLLQAYRDVPGCMPLVLAGGSSDTATFTTELAELARLDERVVMPGYVFGDDLAALYSHARAFVLPSLLEGMPLTLLEAMSYGLPVVVSSIPPHLEAVGVDGPGARVARPGDREDLRAALVRALEDESSERQGAVLRGRHAQGRYDWDEATDLLEDVYLRQVGEIRLPLQADRRSRRPLTPVPDVRLGVRSSAVPSAVPSADSAVLAGAENGDA